jgi:hypothetical protein
VPKIKPNARRINPAYRSLSRPLTILGAERKLYDGDRAGTEKDIRNLSRQGLLSDRTIEVSRKKTLRILTLTKTGHRLLEKANRLADGQAIYHGLRKPREASHDADLYRLYQNEATRIERSGGRPLRVILDYELKKNLNRDFALLGPDTDKLERKLEIAEKYGLEVVNGKILLPDLRIEYQTSEMEVRHLDLELATRDYRPRGLAEKAKAGFALYSRAEDASRNALRSIVDPGSANPIKAAFYAVFMSFFDLVVKQHRSPTDPKAIMSALKNLHDDMIKTAHYAKTEDRVKNIDKTTGLIQKYFVHKEPPALQHGPGLALDFENSLRRSSIETSRYEFKQGILRLSPERALEVDLFPRLVQTICAIANVGPDAPGFIYVGVADKEADGQKIELLDKVTPLRVGQRFVVGIDREVKILKIKTDDYIQKIIAAIRASVLR